MGLNTTYKTLFDIRFLHHYFLDEGTDTYSESGGGNLQERFDNNRIKYDCHNFLKITPTVRTQKVMRDYKIVFRQYKDGMRAAMKEMGDGITPFIPFDTNFYLDFTVEITDALFENYTNINWDKSGLLYLSNLDPVAYVQPSVPEGEMNPHPPAVSVEFSRLSQYVTETAGTDIDINLLNDVSGPELSGKFAFIRLYAIGESTEISLAKPTNIGEFNAITPELDVFLSNRNTIWRFIEEKGATPLYETSGPQPLTENGYIETYLQSGGNGNNSERQYFPNPDAKIIVEDPPASGTYYSEVFI